MNKKNVRMVEKVSADSSEYLDNEKLVKRVVSAMRKVDRGIFLRNTEGDPYKDTPVKIECGQWSSEPSMVGYMAQKARLQPGQHVLEIGTGTGYSTVIDYLLASPGGVIFSLEVHPDLVQISYKNIKDWYFSVGYRALGNSSGCRPRISSVSGGYIFDLKVKDIVSQIYVLCCNGYKGLDKFAPYDRIIATAGAPNGFDESPLVSQLKDGGILLYPSELGPINYVEKGKDLIRKRFIGGKFVELIKDQ